MNRNISPLFALFFLLLNACGSGPADQNGGVVPPSNGPIKRDDPAPLLHGSVFLGLHFSGDLPPFADHLNWEDGGFKGSFVAKARYPLNPKKDGSITVRLVFDAPADIQGKEIFFACKDEAGKWLTSVIDDSNFKMSGLQMDGKFEIPSIAECVPHGAALLYSPIQV